MLNSQSVSSLFRGPNDGFYQVTSYRYDVFLRRRFQCQPENRLTIAAICIPGATYLSWQYNPLHNAGFTHFERVRIVETINATNLQRVALALHDRCVHNSEARCRPWFSRARQDPCSSRRGMRFAQSECEMSRWSDQITHYVNAS